jgi:hypothetical protein
LPFSVFLISTKWRNRPLKPYACGEPLKKRKHESYVDDKKTKFILREKQEVETGNKKPNNTPPGE